MYQTVSRDIMLALFLEENSPVLQSVFFVWTFQNFIQMKIILLGIVHYIKRLAIVLKIIKIKFSENY